MYLNNQLSFIFIFKISFTKYINKGLEEHMHKGWALVCVFTFIAIALETYRNDCIWLVYARIFFLFVQGLVLIIILTSLDKVKLKLI